MCTHKVRGPSNDTEHRTNNFEGCVPKINLMSS